MAAGRAGFTIPILAVVAFAAMLGWFGTARMAGRDDAPALPAAGRRDGAATAPAAPPSSSAVARLEAPAPPPASTPAPPPRSGEAAPAAASPSGSAPAEPGLAPSSPAASTAAATPAAPPPAKAPGAGSEPAPSFDVVRVEPGGESVVAGRAAPGAAVDLTSNGRPLARAVADASGLFAFVPPPLPAGSHELALQTAGPNGVPARSAQSVTVVVAEGGHSAPLVTVTAPGQPTVVLSRPDEGPGSAAAPPSRLAAVPAGPEARARPEAPDPKPGGGVVPGSAAPSGPPKPLSSAPSSAPAATAGAEPGPRPAVRVVSVEAGGAGRLYVSGQASPGATIRFYLNDAFIAPGSTGRDGRLAFSVGRGIAPGDYRIRLDDVDPVTGAVRSRAEVPFTVPSDAVAEAGRPRPAPLAAEPAPAASAARSASAPEALRGPAPAPARPGSPPPAGTGEGPISPASPPALSAAGRPAEPPAERSAAAQGGPSTAAQGGPSAAAAVPSSAATSATTPPSSARVAMASPGTGDARIGAEAGSVPAPIGDPGPVVIPEVSTAIVARGDNLWRISKRIYGEGLRYTVIFGANAPQIRDPDLIYPGQVFVLPVEAKEAASGAERPGG